MRFAKKLLILLSLFIFSCSAVHTNIKSISGDDIQLFLREAPKAEDHPNAGANFLYSYSYVEFFEDGTSVTRILQRIKIFNERGRNVASKSISYREGYQEVKILFANTIKPNGDIVPLDSNDVHDSSEHAGYEFYTDIKVKKFTMPAVENDCVIEYAYEIKNLKPVLSFDYSDTFFCKNFFPIEENVTEIVMPANIELKYKRFNTDISPEISITGRKKKYLFTNVRQKEIIPESRMPSILDRTVFPQVSFWTLDGWNTISNWYVHLVREQMVSDSELERFTKQLIAGLTTDEDKINAIFNFVSQNVRYIAVLLGPHTHKPHRADEIFRKRYGDCKDKTVLLLTMLDIAGIRGIPALVPANGKYFNDGMPTLNAFNHIIAVVPLNGDYLWLDATNETAAYDSPPFALPTKVLFIHPDGSYDFVTSPALNDKRDYYHLDIEYDICRDGNADIVYTYRFFGKAAESVRKSFKYMPPEQRRKFFENRGIEVRDMRLGGFTDTKQPFFIELSGTIKNMAQVLDEDTMVLSNIISFDSYKDITAAASRQYPVNLTQSMYAIETYAYRFPAGFKIKRLPKNYTLNKPFRFRKETYKFKGSVFYVSVESKNEEKVIALENIDDFKIFAATLQKRESSIKNFIFEK